MKTYILFYIPEKEPELINLFPDLQIQYSNLEVAVQPFEYYWLEQDLSGAEFDLLEQVAKKNDWFNIEEAPYDVNKPKIK